MGERGRLWKGLRVEFTIKEVHCIPGIGDSRFVSNPRPQWGDTKRQLE